jgi:hypothetical protein
MSSFSKCPVVEQYTSDPFPPGSLPRAVTNVSTFVAFGPLDERVETTENVMR